MSQTPTVDNVNDALGNAADAVDLPTYPVTRTCPYSAPPVYEEVRNGERPKKVRMQDGNPAWMLTRYEDVRSVLADPRFSADRLAPGFPILAPGQREGLSRQPKFMLSMDGKEHNDARRPVISEFSVRRVATMRPRIQQIVDEAIDELLKQPQPADLVKWIGHPVPAMMVAELVGAPLEQQPYFRDLTSRILAKGVTWEERFEISKTLRKFMDELIQSKAENPGDDLLSRQIIQQREEHGEVNFEGLSALAHLLLFAGHDSSAGLISLGVYTFLTNPEQRAAVMAEPKERIPLAIEEMLRFYSITDIGAARVALEDVEIGGVTIRAGEGVIASVYAANHDPEVFENPGELDLLRGDRHHVAFGYGPHQCLAQNLSRLELEIVFETLFRRIPTLRLAVDVDELPFKYDSVVFGLHALPVTW
ncbi:cytochrome P450 [Kitasatospora gansuensis]